jgi:hypothetical protein
MELAIDLAVTGRELKGRGALLGGVRAAGQRYAATGRELKASSFTTSLKTALGDN